MISAVLISESDTRTQLRGTVRQRGERNGPERLEREDNNDDIFGKDASLRSAKYSYGTATDVKNAVGSGIKNVGNLINILKGSF